MPPRTVPASIEPQLSPVYSWASFALALATSGSSPASRSAPSTASYMVLLTTPAPILAPMPELIALAATVPPLRAIPAKPPIMVGAAVPSA